MYYTGDWLITEDGSGWDVAYEGEPYRSWSYGWEFLATRQVAERVVADQRLYITDKYEFGDALGWDGDTIVHTSPLSGEIYRKEYPPRQDGRYIVGFGWPWYEVSEGMQVLELVSEPPTGVTAETVARTLGVLEKEFPGATRRFYEILSRLNDFDQ